MLTPALALCIAGAAIQAPPSLDAFRSRLDTLKSQVRVEDFEAVTKEAAFRMFRITTPAGTVPISVETRSGGGSAIFVGGAPFARRQGGGVEGPASSSAQCDFLPMGLHARIGPAILGIREVTLSAPGRPDQTLRKEEGTVWAPLQAGSPARVGSPSLIQVKREELVSGAVQFFRTVSGRPDKASSPRYQSLDAPTAIQDVSVSLGHLAGSGDAEGRVSLYGRLPLPWPGTMFVRVTEDGSLTLVLVDAESGLSFRFEKGVCQAWMREGVKRSLLGEAPFRLLPSVGLPSFPSTLPGSTPLPSGPRPLVWQDWPGLPPKPETH